MREVELRTQLLRVLHRNAGHDILSTVQLVVVGDPAQAAHRQDRAKPELRRVETEVPDFEAVCLEIGQQPQLRQCNECRGEVDAGAGRVVELRLRLNDRDLDPLIGQGESGKGAYRSRPDNQHLDVLHGSEIPTSCV